MNIWTKKSGVNGNGDASAVADVRARSAPRWWPRARIPDVLPPVAPLTPSGTRRHATAAHATEYAGHNVSIQAINESVAQAWVGLTRSSRRSVV